MTDKVPNWQAFQQKVCQGGPPGSIMRAMGFTENQHKLSCWIRIGQCGHPQSFAADMHRYASETIDIKDTRTSIRVMDIRIDSTGNVWMRHSEELLELFDECLLQLAISMTAKDRVYQIIKRDQFIGDKLTIGRAILGCTDSGYNERLTPTMNPTLLPADILYLSQVEKLGCLSGPARDGIITNSSFKRGFFTFIRIAELVKLAMFRRATVSTAHFDYPIVISSPSAHIQSDSFAYFQNRLFFVHQAVVRTPAGVKVTLVEWTVGSLGFISHRVNAIELGASCYINYKANSLAKYVYQFLCSVLLIMTTIHSSNYQQFGITRVKRIWVNRLLIALKDIASCWTVRDIQRYLMRCSKSIASLTNMSQLAAVSIP